MAASLGYDSIALLSHSLEDRMEGVRADGRVRSHDELSLLFQVLEMLESMVSSVNDETEIPEVPRELLEALAAPEAGGRAAAIMPPPAVGGEPKKVRV
jgi:chemotaxis protein histidine kinase CheA